MVRTAAYESGPNGMLRRFVIILCLAFAGWPHVRDVSAEPTNWESAKGFRCAALKVASAGRIGFTQLSVTETGIAFTNSLPIREAVLNYNLLNGSGVAAGDFDGDGWCDLYFAPSTGRIVCIETWANGDS